MYTEDTYFALDYFETEGEKICFEEKPPTERRLKTAENLKI